VRRGRGVVVIWRVRWKSVWKEKKWCSGQKKSVCSRKIFYTFMHIVYTFHCRNINAYKYTYMSYLHINILFIIYYLCKMTYSNGIILCVYKLLLCRFRGTSHMSHISGDATVLGKQLMDRHRLGKKTSQHAV
jgi:hypothetical protein